MKTASQDGRERRQDEPRAGQITRWCGQSLPTINFRNKVEVEWRLGVSVSSCLRVLVPWCLGALVSWCLGVLVPRCLGVSVSRFCITISAIWVQFKNSRLAVGAIEVQGTMTGRDMVWRHTDQTMVDHQDTIRQGIKTEFHSVKESSIHIETSAPARLCDCTAAATSTRRSAVISLGLEMIKSKIWMTVRWIE